jgi:FKBP-type peptidyl-prolyl cis-trans isomerase FkpA
MRIIVLCLVSMLVITQFVACKKKEIDQAKLDDDALIEYMSANQIIGATKTSTGLYYVVDSLGDPSNRIVISPNARVAATYTGKFMSNVQLDAGTNVGFYISSVIKGWQEGLAFIGKNGRIRLMIPSALAYGKYGLKDSQGNILVPANSPLFFKIELLNIAN